MNSRRHSPLARTASAAIALAVALTVTFASTPPARADEEDDIQRQIDTQKSGVPDLEHLDTRHAATADLKRLREWLNLAWDLRNKHESDDAREVLDRCLGQAELIRQIIAASLLQAQVEEKEAKLKHTREDIEVRKKAIKVAQDKKKELEGAVGP